MRNFLKEEIQYRYERNRSGKFGGWKGLIIKILILILMIHFFMSFNKDSAKNILWFISGGNEDYSGMNQNN